MPPSLPLDPLEAPRDPPAPPELPLDPLPDALRSPDELPDDALRELSLDEPEPDMPLDDELSSPSELRSLLRSAMLLPSDCVL